MIFQAIIDEEILELVDNIQFKRFKQNEIIIKEQDQGDEIYFLIEGECQITLRGKLLAILSAKDVFGELAFITKQKRSATVKSIKPSILISFTIKLDNIQNNPLACANLYKNITHEIVRKLYASNNYQHNMSNFLLKK